MPHDRPILLELPRQLEGPRVIVRPFTDADALTVHEAIRESVEHVRPWLPWYGLHETLDDTLEWLRRMQAQWLLRDSFAMGIFARHDGTFLGGISLGVRSWRVPAYAIGYWVRASAQGHGYVGEAVRLVTTLAFETLRAQRVMIRCNARNTRSRNVAERCGYVYEGCLRHQERDTSGELCDMLLFAMIPDDYQRHMTAGW